MIVDERMVMKMKKNYQLPEITLLTLSQEDVISTSLLDEINEVVYIDENDKVSFGDFLNKL